MGPRTQTRILAGVLAHLQRFRKAMDRVRERGGELRPGDIHRDRRFLLDLEEHWYVPAIERAGTWDGVRDLIDLFDRNGLVQVVASDYVASHKLKALGLSGRFHRAYAGEELGFLKPSSELFHHIVRDLGVPADRVLHLGDRPETDGVAASGAGCRVHIFDSGFSSPRELLKDLTGG